jgi:O-acetyl-ADP-ribose deacetylase (regulator of RNase III)
VADIQLVLVDPGTAVCAAWEERFTGLPNVSVVNGRFEELPAFDCMVSAANSFGLMDGGVDLAIVRFFGDALRERVAARIADEYLGEQPVGTSLIIETGNPAHPYIAHTPTMRLPMRVARTDYAYLAMWAMLLAVRRHNRASVQPPINVVACPGLCTATGRMPPEEFARQMALAYRHFLWSPRAARLDWKAAYERQDALGRGGDFAFIPTRPQEPQP